MKTLEEIIKELDAKIPRSVVSERDGGGGRKLSYLEGHYVIDRLNKVFGHLNWSSEIIEIKEVVNTTNRGEFPAYLAKVRLSVSVTPNTQKISEGYGYGADKSAQNAHELAIKEAVTDGLKVAAKNLGMSLGLALYDKTQENVDDEEGSREINGTETSPESPTPSPRGPKADKKDSPQDKPSGNESAAKIEEAIRSYVNVAKAQKKLTNDDFKKYLADQHQTDTLSKLSLDQLKLSLKYLEALVQ